MCTKHTGVNHKQKKERGGTKYWINPFLYIVKYSILSITYIAMRFCKDYTYNVYITKF